MIVKIFIDDKETWSFSNIEGQTTGSTNKKYLEDGTQQKIIDILNKAKLEADGQLSISDNEKLKNASPETIASLLLIERSLKDAVKKLLNIVSIITN